jgi:catechol 2,3-dioxygenase-like lactoylglutathione lyase family enzyme
MNTTQITTAETPRATAVRASLEAISLPVADLERAKTFYEGLGWRLDIDFKPDGQHRAVQFTPPGSAASIQFAEGRTLPGPLQGMLLVVDDIDAAREDLITRGVEVSEVSHSEPGKGQVPGHDPQRRSYSNRASFADPDGNVWQLQEITERLPGRGGLTGGPAGLAALLREASEEHGKFEAIAAPHDWWDWYAAYMDARQAGSSLEDATVAADRYMADAKGIVVTRPAA